MNKTCLESCYWHCCEKWFCYDESIALWEDPDAEQRNHIGWDNMAYWDSISVIANRNVVTIQPLAETKPPQQQLLSVNIDDQFNLQDDLHRRLSEVFQHSSMLKEDPPKSGENEKQVTFHLASDDSDKALNEATNQYCNFETTPTQDNEFNTLKESKDKESKNGDTVDAPLHKFPEKAILKNRMSADNFPTTSRYTENQPPDKIQANIFTISGPPPLNKKPTELRLIKQNSMPNFYIETPEISDVPPITADQILTSPVLPNTPQFTYDLRSIVELETNKKQTNAEIEASEKSKRLVNIRKKIAPLIIKTPSLRNITLKHNMEKYPS
ncbi:uncharacterized protein LOC123300556 isoform X2 [Chrysoperla carnea]|uniref:uncharacterized protein LOC123300556 isoform X2 n=1 Tax=Chrysoperla carnea TaxID=189513 RepID=UPI001D092E08|nr:uncharacterized protein LOC123300556 isoform X2 [Chrysoperla carnea]